MAPRLLKRELVEATIASAAHPRGTMAQGSNTLHESPEHLTAQIIDHHRAIVSLMEELEAVDWYDQRVAACTDDELKAILAHNRDEEKEHAAMLLEWLRRHDGALDKHLRRYLYSSGSILEREHAEEEGDAAGAATSLHLGSLRKAVSK